jgi:hypothetical protein
MGERCDLAAEPAPVQGTTGVGTGNVEIIPSSPPLAVLR